MCVCTRMKDPSAVQDKGPAKSITVEDSFKDCSSLPAAQHVIKVLAPDLLARMVEDYQVRPWQRHMYFACRRCQKALVNLPAGVLIRSREGLVFVLFDLKSPVALREKSCCTVRSVHFLHVDGVKKGLVSLLACVLIRSCDVSASVLFDLRSPVAVCGNSCCTVCFGTQVSHLPNAVVHCINKVLYFR